MHKRLIVYHTPGPNGGTFRIIENPTLGDVRYARNNGAFILHRLVKSKGRRVYGAWVTEESVPVVIWEEDARN